LNDDHPATALPRAAFQCKTAPRAEQLCFFLPAMARRLRRSHLSVPGARPNTREEKIMQQLFRLSAAPVAGLFAMALAAITTPASAADYCRQDAISGMRSCSYVSLEQCQAMSSGIGGTCYRDPFLPQAGASSAYAYAPHGAKKSAVKH
jgi:hypothetical protein